MNLSNVQFQTVRRLDCKFCYDAEQTCPVTSIYLSLHMSSKDNTPSSDRREAVCLILFDIFLKLARFFQDSIVDGVDQQNLQFKSACIFKRIVIMASSPSGRNVMLSTFLLNRNCTEFDWYQNWANLRDIISQYIKYDSKILNVGAGNSPFSEAMYAEGYKNITNIDFSEIVVEDMQLKYKNNGYNSCLKYQLGDVRSMKEFQNQTFDCIIDKGLLDSILCGAYSKQNSKKMLREISRVLKNKGIYICVSYGDPDIRNHYFQDKSEKYDWGKKNQWPYKIFKPTIEQSEKELVFNDKDKQKNKDYYHYVYVLGKGQDNHIGVLQGQAKSSNAMINSSNVMK